MEIVGKMEDWERVKIKLLERLNKTKSDEDLQIFVEDVVGGFLYATNRG